MDGALIRRRCHPYVAAACWRMEPMPEPARVALLVTCLVDLFRPSVGFAAVALLERAGCTVEVPRAQTCCGQPAYNSGDRADAKAIARQVIETFAGYDYVVVPSGSCAGMVKVHYPELFADEPEMRELAVKTQPRRLLASVAGLGLRELPGAEVCCGFGGTFCVKYPEISDKMVTDKANDIAATGADAVLAGDLGCLLNIAGKLSRLGIPVEVRHVAEVLAGMTDAVPPIGAGVLRHSRESGNPGPQGPVARPGPPLSRG